MSLSGELFRNQKGRLTQRVLIGEKYYFIKQHHGVGWREIIKNICQLRFPIISAQPEWQAIHALEKLGILTPKVVAYGKRGLNPAKQQSFILMEELAPVLSLEDLTKAWLTHPPTFKMKQHWLKQVAEIAKTLHENGINHRDFYLCHFLLNVNESENGKLYLIDLHRAQIRRVIPKRWIIKDLAGLYFSSKDIGLTKRDLLRFIKIYRGESLRSLMKEMGFWEKVIARGENLYRDHSK